MSTVKRKTEAVARISAALAEDQLARLKEIFPECFTEGRVDFDKLRETLGEEIDSRPERYSFTWAGKRDAIRLLQTPSRATLIPCPKESVNFEETGNLFIEGDNLEVLKLLYKSYFGRVKMIYIDPPYNTGNDFIYPDNFADPLDTYLRLTGQKEANGNLLTSNPETSGRYHSAWLSMMYPRLFLARQFLREDGAIFVSIDDHEVQNLRLVMNEIFGEENFVATIIWQKVFGPKNTARHFSEDHDFIVCYAKNAVTWTPTALPRTEEADARYENPDNDPRGPWSSSDLTARNYYSEGQYEVASPSGKKFKATIGAYWRVKEEKFKELDRDKRIWWGPDGKGMPRLKRFLSEVKQGIVPQTLWKYQDVGHTQEAKQELLKYVKFEHTDNVLDTVKPPRLIKRMLQISTAATAGHIVLDFFAGSGTTAHGVLAQNTDDGGNRRFICVQLPERLPIEEKRLKTLSDIARTRIREVIQELTTRESQKLKLNSGEEADDRGFRAFKLGVSNYRPWTGTLEKDAETYGKTMGLYTDPLAPGSKPENVIWEVVIKEGFDLNSSIEKLSEIKGNTVYQVSDSERGQTFRICLDDALKPATIKALSLGKDDLFICRDKALNDEGAANLALQCRLKTI
jgi:adenine-specific DNA-methyltransferase